MNKKLLIDIAERTAWTAAQAALAYLATRLVDVPAAYAVPLAAGLAVVKGYVASHVGSDTSAAALPGSLDAH